MPANMQRLLNSSAVSVRLIVEVTRVSVLIFVCVYLSNMFGLTGRIWILRKVAVLIDDAVVPTGQCIGDRNGYRGRQAQRGAETRKEADTAAGADVGARRVRRSAHAIWPLVQYGQLGVYRGR